MACNRCGSWAINHGHHGRDGSEPNLCDVCYWRQRCEQCTASIAAKDAEIARLREVLTVIAYPLNIGKVYHMDAVKQARAALAPVVWQ